MSRFAKCLTGRILVAHAADGRRYLYLTWVRFRNDFVKWTDHGELLNLLFEVWRKSGLSG